MAWQMVSVNTPGATSPPGSNHHVQSLNRKQGSMTDLITADILADIVSALQLSPDTAARVLFDGTDRLPSCFPVTQLAMASIGAVGLSISELIGAENTTSKPSVVVNSRLASLWFGSSIRPQGWAMPAAWDAIAGDYRTRDGWIKLHTNAPHHRAAALTVLECANTRQAVADSVATWTGDELEAAIVANGGCAAKLRTSTEWAHHAQGLAVAAEPLIAWDHSIVFCPSEWRPTPGRPLSGLRVLDLTRVLAGPVATRTLAGFGAEVLRIDPPGWDEPGLIPEVALGKRCARLDLKCDEGLNRLKQLLSQSDILIHGYRSDALERLGLSAIERQRIRPGLIDISLDAYGHTGPWAKRRGFDSLVQFSAGIASDGMSWKHSETPVSLPVQALDQATGYLIAAAAIRGVTSRLRQSGPIVARLSLARTAKLLNDHKCDFGSTVFTPVNDLDYSETIEHTAWGPAQRLHSPLSVQDAPVRWDRPAVALGSHENWC
jgi:crotonobetainyl-CoA:carnitine CoA-transferase CaiB-like acyl-CoA transferase